MGKHRPTGVSCNDGTISGLPGVSDEDASPPDSSGTLPALHRRENCQ